MSDNLYDKLKRNIELKVEKGLNQYEVDLPPTPNLLKLIQNITSVKKLLTTQAKEYNGIVDFMAKPYKYDYGSSIHIHINLLNLNEVNLFNNNKYIQLIASGLCYYMNQSFLVFSPTQNCYERYDSKFMAPTKICWGNNNRTVAIRTPDVGPKRLEHRVASANADFYLLFYYILRAIELTLINKDLIPLVDKIYGNAFDAQYDLLSFPSSIQKSLEVFNSQF